MIQGCYSCHSIVLASCLLALAGGCVSGSGGSSGASTTTATGGAGEGSPNGVLGFEWCVQAASAAGNWSQPPNDGQNILHPDTGNWLRGCLCYCPEDNDTLVNGGAGSLLGDDLVWYDNQVSALRNLAKAACLSRQVELELAVGDVLVFNLAWTETCDEAVSDEVPVQRTECVKHEQDCSLDIPIEGTGGQTGTESDGGGAVVYGIGDYSDVVDGSDPTEIDIDFVQRLATNLSMLEDDNIGVVLANSAQGYGFKFETLGAQSLPVALGFQQDDVVLTLNGKPLASIADVTIAFENFHQERDFVVTLSRRGGTETIDFALVDLPTYP